MKLLGGINLPKVIECCGNDGRSYTQLVKGWVASKKGDPDDLRQDAVMQQVFQLINTLLSADPEASRRKLRVRTYKVRSSFFLLFIFVPNSSFQVLPLTPISGVLEFVKETLTLGTYLVGASGVVGAHGKYRPKDKSPIACREEMRNASDDQKLRVYLGIMKSFKPVFKHFFLENWTNPAEVRLQYKPSIIMLNTEIYMCCLF